MRGEHDAEDNDLSAEAQEQDRDGGPGPGETDAPEDARVAQAVQLQGEQPVVDHAEEHQQGRAARRVEGECAPCIPALQPPVEGQGHRGPGQEQEQGEDQVPGGEAVPLGVVGLGLEDPVQPVEAEREAEGEHHLPEAQDHHHVEAPEGVDGEDPSRRG